MPKGVSSKDVYDWIRKTVIKKNKGVDQRICPFAEKVLKDKAIQVLPGKSELRDQIAHCCDIFDIFALDIVIIYIQYKITEKDLSKACAAGAKANPLYAVFYDHPDNSGLHKGVSFSFKKCPLILIQKLDKLKEAQKKLRATSWYEDWGLDPNDTMFY